MPYKKTDEYNDKGQRLYETPSGKKVTQKQIGLIESKKRRKHKKGGDD